LGGKLKASIFYTINPLLYENSQFVFLSPSLGGLGATYAVHLRLIRKSVVNFLLAITELVSLGVMVEALRANID